MSDLQISLLGIGAVVIAGVLLYNSYQQRRLRERLNETFGEPHIKILDLATGTESLFDSISGSTPSWIPDGDHIAFSGKVTVTTTTTTSTYTELFIMNADFSGATQVTSFNSSVTWPTWSFDGTELAFRLGPLGTDPRGISIYKLSLASGGVTLLRSGADKPDWKP